MRLIGLVVPVMSEKVKEFLTPSRIYGPYFESRPSQKTTSLLERSRFSPALLREVMQEPEWRHTGAQSAVNPSLCQDE